MEGWIKLHRKILYWQWATSPNHLSLMMNILLRANHKETKWRRMTVYPGQLLTGRKQLAIWTGLSEQQVRSLLRDLVESKEITSRAHSKFSIITVVNWHKYQCDATESTSRDPRKTTSNQPAINQQVTTSKNEKNEKNEKNGYRAPTPDDIVDLWNRVLGKTVSFSHGLGAGKHLEKFLEAREFFRTAEDWQRYFEKIAQYPFLLGENKKSWKISLPWAVDYDNAVKVMDGAYDATSRAQKDLQEWFAGDSQ